MPEPQQRPGRSKQDYQTPPAFLAAVKRKFGFTEFGIDLAASRANAVTNLYYSEQVDSLQHRWTAGSARGPAWLNPPFARIAPWVERACIYRHRTDIFVLVPAGVGANWWAKSVHTIAAVYSLNGRLTFVGCDAPYPKDCALLHYGPSVEPGYHVWNWRV